MKTFIASIIALSFTASVSAQTWESWDNPTKPFDATKDRIADKVEIEWRLADNINAACELASKEFGNNGFGGQKMQGCAFWWGSKCVIITKKKPTMHTVGHEMRHCFYGAWH